MRILIIAATVVVASTALAQSKRVTRTVATGNSQVIARTISNCSIPNLVTPKRVYSSYQSTSSAFAYKVCKEYATYEADVTGKTWNTKDTEVAGTRRLSSRIETVTNNSSVQVPTYEVRGRDGEILYSVSDVNWALSNTQVLLECGNARQNFERNSTDIGETACAQQQ